MIEINIRKGKELTGNQMIEVEMVITMIQVALGTIVSQTIEERKQIEKEEMVIGKMITKGDRMIVVITGEIVLQDQGKIDITGMIGDLSKF